jgi:hypothetical protein
MNLLVFRMGPMSPSSLFSQLSDHIPLQIGEVSNARLDFLEYLVRFS